MTVTYNNSTLNFPQYFLKKLETADNIRVYQSDYLANKDFFSIVMKA